MVWRQGGPPQTQPGVASPGASGPPAPRTRPSVKPGCLIKPKSFPPSIRDSPPTPAPPTLAPPVPCQEGPTPDPARARCGTRTHSPKFQARSQVGLHPLPSSQRSSLKLKAPLNPTNWKCTLMKAESFLLVTTTSPVRVVVRPWEEGKLRRGGGGGGDLEGFSVRYRGTVSSSVSGGDLESGTHHNSVPEYSFLQE